MANAATETKRSAVEVGVAYSRKKEKLYAANAATETKQSEVEVRVA